MPTPRHAGYHGDTGAHTLGHAFLLLHLGLLMAVGCVAFGRTTTHIEHGTPIDSTRVDQIVIGQTTRADLFKWFGPPHSMFNGEAELVNYENVGFYSYSKNRQLATLDEDQYALLYRFDETDARTKVNILIVPFFQNAESSNQVSFGGDELLVLLNRNTHVVTDVAWRSTACE